MASTAHLLALAAALGGARVEAGQTPPGKAPSSGVTSGKSATGVAPTTTFTLRNGLKVIVQPDPRVPIVTAIVIYNVGSKDETAGQHGYAHLFEHLMLDGSVHWPESATKALTDLGASEINATTTQDRTIFYETVPRGALERTLFLEADRMGHLAAALTPTKVAREVDVVLNEKRQRGGAPYGEDWIGIRKDMYPADHPYHHGVIGDEADLRAVTVDKAADWFRTYYGPANATLVLTGDVAPAEVRALVETYFAGLSPRAPLDRLLTRVSPMPGTLRRERFEAVPSARIYATYTAPPAGSPTIADLDLIAQMMANGSASRLARRLIDALGVAAAVMPTFDEQLLSSEMGFVVVVRSPDDVRRAEAALDAEIARFVSEGPTPDELDRARKARTDYVRRSQESTFGRAFLLMRGASLTDDPDYAATYLRQLAEATPDSVRRTAAAVYGRPGHRLIVRPLPDVKASPGDYDPAKGPPPLGAMAPVVFPAAERMRLPNGLEVVLVPRAGTMTTSMTLRFDAGTASTAGAVDRVAVAMLAGQGDPRVARAEALGGGLAVGSSADHSDVRLSIPAAELAAGVALLGDVATRPPLTEARLSHVKAEQRDALQREVRDGPSSRRMLRNAVFGADHPYGAEADPATDIRAVDAVDLPTVAAWMRGHIRPDRARVYVAGDTTMAALRPMLTAAFGGWRIEGPPTIDRSFGTVPSGPAPRLIVIDRPGAQQSFVGGGRALPPTRADDDLSLALVDGVYGYMTGARIRTTLREEKGWTYGIGSGVEDARGPRLWEIAGSVDRAHTGDTIAELIREMRAMTGDDPPTRAEIDRIVNGSANRVAARLESNADIVTSMADSETYGRPYDAVARDGARLRALSTEQVRRAAGGLLDPASMHWVVVGDWARIRDQFEGLGLGTPRVIRSDGG